MSNFIEDTKPRVPSRPRSGRYYTGIRDDYSQQLARGRMSPEHMARILREADTGKTKNLYGLYDRIEEDGHTVSALNKRKRAVIARTFQVTPAIEDDKKAERAADLVRSVILGADGEDGIDNWYAALYDMVDAIGKGFSLTQIKWTLAGTTWRPESLIAWPQHECILGDPRAIYQDRPDEVRITTEADRYAGEILTPNQWIVHVSKNKSGPIAKSALLRSVAWWWLFKNFSVRDWTIFAERYGMPLRVGKYPSTADDDERRAIEDAVTKLGADGAAVLPLEAVIDFVQTSGTAGGSPYPSLAAFCNSEISKAILGNTLTVEAGDKGARSLGEVHADAQGDMLRSDAQALARTIRRDLVRPIVLFNLGQNYPIPNVEFLEEEENDQKAMAESDEIIVRGIGLPVSKKYLYEKYEIPPPEDDDDIVQPPVKKSTGGDDISEEPEIEETAEVDEDTDKVEDKKKEKKETRASRAELTADSVKKKPADPEDADTVSLRPPLKSRAWVA